MSLKLTSSAFSEGGDIPTKYSCNGSNISPPLSIDGVPREAESLVLICDDPDAAKEPAGSGHTFDHWILYNIEAKDQEIPENSMPGGAQNGLNGKGEANYTGPCPPTFKHTYIFKLYAVDKKLDFDNPPGKNEVLNQIKDSIVEQAKLTACYEQPK